MGSAALWAIAMLVAATGGPPAWPEAAPGGAQARPGKAKPKGGSEEVLRFLPKARKLSIYTRQARVQILNREVSFEAPPAYQAGFEFWSKKMRGEGKTELIEFVITTDEPDEKGEIPFRRRSPRVMIELLDHGRPMEPYGSLQDDVKTLVWEGKLDRYGNVKEIRKVGGSDNEKIAQLTIPQMDAIFPRLDGPLELRVGEGFVEKLSLPLPARLSIKGLEDLRLLRTREYTLKRFTPRSATFEVRTTYANDPQSKPTEPRTTCRIGGGGTGEATFDVRKGVFVRTRVPETLTIDIEAPLRPLPGMDEGEDPGTGRSHLKLDLTSSATQTVKRLWGEEDD
ncbi:MAG: hypothetical protein ACE5JH_10925 [Acidobacteriota bacterium]